MLFRSEDPNRWPDQIPPGFQGPLQYTLGMCRFLEGNWHCAGIVEFWYGRSLDDTAPPSRFWREWWYDSARWGTLAVYPPQEGELVGVFVGSGDLRGRTWTRATCPGVCERSNVAFVPFTTGVASYRYYRTLAGGRTPGPAFAPCQVSGLRLRRRRAPGTQQEVGSMNRFVKVEIGRAHV